jgi:alpha-mannosidase
MSELLLRHVELFSTMASIHRKDFKYPHKEINQLWELVLTNQFHDVLPGSSIGLVYEDARKYYQQVMKKGTELLTTAMNTLYPQSAQDHSGFGVLIVNPLAWSRTEVVMVSSCHDLMGDYQPCADGNGGYILASNTPSMGYVGLIPRCDSLPGVNVSKQKDVFILENVYLQVKIDQGGRIISVFDKQVIRELIPKGCKANQFVIYEDQPLFWDAWDVEIYHMAKGREIPEGKVEVSINI